MDPSEVGRKMEGVPIEDTMLSDMCPDIESAFCFPHKYRTINGECNNVKNPTWGITGAAYLRILQPTYQDGRSTRHPVDLHFSLCVVVVVVVVVWGNWSVALALGNERARLPTAPAASLDIGRLICPFSPPPVHCSVRPPAKCHLGL